jgi:cell division transport system permease protein
MLSLLRIIKFSFQDISRNVWLSMATITILLLALLSINMLVAVRTISEHAVLAIKEKMDISLYLKTNAAEEDINKLRADIAQMPEVKSIVYISQEQALNSFREDNINNPDVMQALQALDRNPLLGSLTIVPNSLKASAQLISNLQRLDAKIIESRDFTDNSLIVSRIDNITQRINEVGLIIIALFILISLLVVYNAIRVSVYTHRQEIEIMRLVGASNFFIYTPFVFASFLYTLISVLIVIIIFFPFLTLLQPYLEVFFTGYNVNILSYFSNNFWYIFGIQFAIILIINILASLLAVRRYAKN